MTSFFQNLPAETALDRRARAQLAQAADSISGAEGHRRHHEAFRSNVQALKCRFLPAICSMHRQQNFADVVYPKCFFSRHLGIK